MTIYAMIPARAGSKRVPGKALRDLGGKPLIAWAVEACKEAGCFDEIYINTDWDELLGVALEYGVEFYKRDPELATDTATNDEFAYDFFINTGCDILCQVNPTSPFTRPEDIGLMVDVFKEKKLDTLHTVKNIQIECLYQGEPINFVQNMEMPPSQDLIPIQAFVNSVMIWRADMFMINMDMYGCAVYGGEDNPFYYPVYGSATLDIDTEDDLKLAQAMVAAGTYD